VLSILILHRASAQPSPAQPLKVQALLAYYIPADTGRLCALISDICNSHCIIATTCMCFGLSACPFALASPSVLGVFLWRAHSSRSPQSLKANVDRPDKLQRARRWCQHRHRPPGQRK
jgi:hypothetical protein